MSDKMTDKRAGIFEEDLDISGFAPKPPARAEQVKAVAEQAGFRSRGPLPPRVPPLLVPLVPAARAERPATSRTPPAEPGAMPDAQREQRRHRTGRNQQLNLKVRAQDAEAFYAIADAQGWVLGDVFARAVAALTEKLQEDRQ